MPERAGGGRRPHRARHGQAVGAARGPRGACARAVAPDAHSHPLLGRLRGPCSAGCARGVHHRRARARSEKRWLGAGQEPPGAMRRARGHASVNCLSSRGIEGESPAGGPGARESTIFFLATSSPSHYLTFLDRHHIPEGDRSWKIFSLFGR